jgi:orotidine-5'-phosphate decarboxylase
MTVLKMSDPQKPDPRIIIALDYAASAPALALAEQLDPAACRLKVGKELFTAAGPAVLEKLMRRGFEIFLDLKFHDIPNTTAQACKAAAELGLWMVNVHALGGRKMLVAAADAIAQSSKPPKLISVTLSRQRRWCCVWRRLHAIAVWTAWCVPRKRRRCCVAIWANHFVW